MSMTQVWPGPAGGNVVQREKSTGSPRERAKAQKGKDSGLFSLFLGSLASTHPCRRRGPARSLMEISLRAGPGLIIFLWRWSAALSVSLSLSLFGRQQNSRVCFTAGEVRFAARPQSGAGKIPAGRPSCPAQAATRRRGGRRLTGLGLAASARMVGGIATLKLLDADLLLCQFEIHLHFPCIIHHSALIPIRNTKAPPSPI